MSCKVIIIGGVAGGASTAARLRRLDEKAEIIIIERGDYISYANCGLPYYIGGAIEERDSLLVMTPQQFKERLNIEVRIKNEALKIERDKKEIVIRNIEKGREYKETYDYLVLSPGAEPLRPPIPGINNPGIFSLRTIPDTDRIYDYISERNPKKAVVVGAGYIGLEMIENLKQRDLEVTVIELAPHILPPIDADIAALIQQYLREQGVNLKLADGVKEFHQSERGNRIELNSGETMEAELVLLSIGVKPDIKLAKEAGLATDRGIKVNEFMQTSEPTIYAIGDAVEVINLVTGKPAIIPLGGPANKQGRIAANNISGKREHYRGTQGTSVLKIFDMTMAMTGANERLLSSENIEFQSIIIHAHDHATYYPDANPLTLKMLFDRNGKLLGAQAFGYSRVEKRIDVIATALRTGKTIYDLQQLELAYAPPYSSAKDPVNIAGFVAGNILEGFYETINAADLIEIKTSEKVQVLDVRDVEEHEEARIKDSINIPLNSLRKRLDELDREKEIITYCSVGLRSYLAYRILIQNGFKRVRNLNGGFKVYQAYFNELSTK
ncbi:MAG: FAD-dependent oxidoreductase [Bacillota bacterium]